MSLDSSRTDRRGEVDDVPSTGEVAREHVLVQSGHLRLAVAEHLGKQDEVGLMREEVAREGMTKLVNAPVEPGRVTHELPPLASPKRCLARIGGARD